MDDAVAQKVKAHFSTYPKKLYSKGQILIFGGENPKDIYYLKRGRVQQYDISEKGEELVVNVFKPSSFFPMSWAINRTPNQYFFKAVIDSEAYIIPTEDALIFIKDNPDILLDLLSRLYKGMDGLLGRMVNLMSGTAAKRLLYELMIESRRFGKKAPNGKIVLSINESELAARAGLTRETVSREIHKLKDLGYVNIKGQTLHVDLNAIEKEIG